MIDRYDAPEGMVAVRDYDWCEGCFYNNKRDCPTRDNSKAVLLCDIEYRNDMKGVIFKTRADFEEMLKQEIAQFYGFEKDDLLILVTHEDKHS